MVDKVPILKKWISRRDEEEESFGSWAVIIWWHFWSTCLSERTIPSRLSWQRKAWYVWSMRLSPTSTILLWFFSIKDLRNSVKGKSFGFPKWFKLWKKYSLDWIGEAHCPIPRPQYNPTTGGGLWQDLLWRMVSLRKHWSHSVGYHWSNSSEVISLHSKTIGIVFREVLDALEAVPVLMAIQVTKTKRRNPIPPAAALALVSHGISIWEHY